ncbi:collagen-like protein [Diaphorobacter aerolatus]|uniref:Collagen-like protein n=1 Tax=Diaphorobacter aerolatus TaxID=1288495 RepID=A0A7H0GGW3_9BURK|nr:collagen-like protein [Diaphorobacter aerolatus]QNP47529.1 collagen-like protein [Diaphorobacter aerolatus]
MVVQDSGGSSLFLRVDDTAANNVFVPTVPASMAQQALTCFNAGGQLGPCSANAGAGPDGATPLTGTLGATGATGPAGAAGATGATGPTGATGINGTPGPTGPTGAQGIAGPMGPQGLPGMIGPQGIPGVAGANGPTGVTGATGPTGATGAIGATGSTGPGVEPGYLSASNISGAIINVVIGGTPVPLPFTLNSANFLANGTNTVFTATTAGSYLVSYKIRTTAALLMSARVSINGVPAAPLTDAPGVSVSSFEAQAIIALAAGDTIALELADLIAAAILQNGAGAYMTVVRVQ